jgi:SRSO17 transposase
VPTGERFRTRHALALEMLDRSGPVLPHAWVAGDDEMGRSSAFRQALRDRGERYLLAVPSNTPVRDLGATPPPYTGRGRRPVVPFARADRWRGALAEGIWAVVDVRDGGKGPLVVQVATARVQAKTDRRRAGPEETLVAVRAEQPDKSWKHDYYLSDAPAGTAVSEFARVAKAAHRVEECLNRAKGEAGLADYEVRTWRGWHHHQALSLIATWFLTVEARRGKKDDPGVDRAAVGGGHRRAAEAAVGV